MNDAQRKQLEERLIEERSRITRVIDEMNRSARSDEERDQSGDLSALPTHVADLGSDEQQRELDASVNQNESETLAEINAALERLYKTPERYGVDERTGKPIPMSRLEVIPWARFDVEGQTAHERSEGA